jgi:hypothetical protein
MGEADAGRSGWSIEKLGEARRYFDGLAKGSASLSNMVESLRSGATPRHA